MSEVIVERFGTVRPAEVMDLRVHAGLPTELEQNWEERIGDALCIITARTVASTALIGVGFIMGSENKATLTHVSIIRDRHIVHGDYKDIAERIRESAASFATERGSLVLDYLEVEQLLAAKTDQSDHIGWGHN